MEFMIQSKPFSKPKPYQVFDIRVKGGGTEVAKVGFDWIRSFFLKLLLANEQVFIFVLLYRCCQGPWREPGEDGAPPQCEPLQQRYKKTKRKTCSLANNNFKKKLLIQSKPYKKTKIKNLITGQ